MKKPAKTASILTLAAGITAASAAGIAPIPESHAAEAVKIDDLYSYPLDSYLVSAEALHVRTKASAASPKADILHLGDSLKVISYPNADWAKVHYKNGKTGFVSTHYIVKEATTVKTTAKTKVYTEKAVKTTLPKSTSVSFLGWKKTPNGGFDFGWALVDYGGSTGYISTKDLQKLK
ncbi:SH3 domain-containing protein [Bacillus sp. ISL-51]|uniref:SH3 domain-containing protein n=1 Tax=Bacteria TaxID=2 RepID=UPI001BEA24D3|nr:MULTISPECIES: SH3 domain-containing protein [Bacteria]MBT2572924.1 SH3 domain-containing protein [Bacillus sp. ISL-51]MBT2635350.1 SH3 domain-containing protein [Bacillus sp. ISL-26]MBT2713397.1 SH3 domain-containing protein [Pseudomonas sp. ISL-88]MBY8911623.1 SH3 domain-containing protein [Bacillus sp. YC2]